MHIARALTQIAFICIAIDAHATSQPPIILPDMKIELSVNTETLLEEFGDTILQYTERMEKICRAHGSTYRPFYMFAFGASGNIQPPADFNQIVVLSENLLSRFPAEDVGFANLGVALQHPRSRATPRRSVSSIHVRITSSCRIDRAPGK